MDFKKYIENLQKVADNKLMPYKERVEAVAEIVLLQKGIKIKRHETQ